MPRDIPTASVTAARLVAGNATSEDLATAVPSLSSRGEGSSRHNRFSLLVFSVGAERYAIDLAAVQEVIECPAPRHVPGWELPLLGLMATGGQLLPLVSLAALLEVPAGRGGAALVLHSAAVALEVDDVEEVLEIEGASLLSPPLGTAPEDPLKAVVNEGGQLVAVVDPVSLACTALAKLRQ
jgi:purine-binding chemotaxis protein CheW